MSDTTQSVPQPQREPGNAQPQPAADGQTNSAAPAARPTETQSPTVPQNQADDEMRKLLQDLAQASATLGNRQLMLQARIASLGMAAGADSTALNRPAFRRDVAYALQDMKRVTGREFLADGTLADEMNHLATTMPGLTDSTLASLLEETPTIVNQGVVSNIREAARVLTAAGDRQSAPQFRGIVDAIEDRVRRYTEPKSDPAPTRDSTPLPTAAAERATTAPVKEADDATSPAIRTHETLPEATRRVVQQQGGKPQGEPPAPGQSTAEKWMRALRAPVPTGMEIVRPLPGESMIDRISQFEAKLAEGKTHRLLQDAEKSGTRAIESTEQFVQGPGRGILRKMESAASTEPGGMQTVLREMQPGGRYANLRTEFDNAYQQDQIFRGAYDKMSDDITRFGKDRDAVTNNYTARNLNPAELDGRFQRAEEALGEALSKVPGKQPGKSALDEMAEKLAEVLRAAVDRIKGIFRPGAETEAQPQSRAAPGMSL